MTEKIYKILVFGNGTLSVGQQERKLCEEFCSQGHKVTLLCDTKHRVYGVSNVPKHKLLKIIHIPANEYTFPALKALLEDDYRSFDFVLGMDQSVVPYVAEFKRLTNLKCFCIILDIPMHVIDGKDPVNYNFSYSQRFFYWLTCSLELDSVIFNHQVTCDLYYNMYKRESKCVWYAVSDDFYNILPPEEKQNYIISCGRVIPYKGYHLSVEAIRRTKYNYVHMGISGENLDVWVKGTKEALNGRFRFIHNPSDDEKFKLMARAYCLVHPQISEWMGGLPPIEAWSVGTPAIAFDYPILRELYEDCVVWARPKSVTDLRRAIKLLYSDKDLYVDLQKRGQERFKKYFTRKTMAENLIKVMEEE